MRKLVHLPNKPDLLTPEELGLYRVGQFVGAKLMPEHRASHIAQLDHVHPGGYYMARLRDTRERDGSLPSFQALGSNWAYRILELEPFGVYDYQADNEPNNQLGVQQAFVWQWLVGEAIKFCRLELARSWAKEGYSADLIQWKSERVRIFLAPLADGPGHWQEIEQPKGWWDAYKILLQQPGLVQGLCVNSYWQYKQYAIQDGFGANCTKYRRWLLQLGLGSLPMIITEWGCSLIDRYPPEERANPSLQTLQTIEGEMLGSYSDWLRWTALSCPYVESTTLFISPRSVGWRGFEPSQRVLSSIASY